MFRISIIALACAFMFAAPHRAVAQQSTPAAGTSHIDPALAAKARITLDSARTLALGKVPHGTIASEELERENGHLIYSFDVRVQNKPGIQEVNINALTGGILGMHHEGAAKEQLEAHADSVAARKSGSHPPSR